MDWVAGNREKEDGISSTFDHLYQMSNIKSGLLAIQPFDVPMETQADQSITIPWSMLDYNDT